MPRIRDLGINTIPGAMGDVPLLMCPDQTCIEGSAIKCGTASGGGGGGEGECLPRSDSPPSPPRCPNHSHCPNNSHPPHAYEMGGLTPAAIAQLRQQMQHRISNHLAT
jgi:hypothetical protein